MEARTPLQPIHAVELYPMPKLKENSSKGLAGAAASKKTGPTTTITEGGGAGTATDDDGQEGGPPGGKGALEAGPGGQQLEVAPSLSDVTVQGADIFEVLQVSMLGDEMHSQSSGALLSLGIVMWRGYG